MNLNQDSDTPTHNLASNSNNPLDNIIYEYLHEKIPPIQPPRKFYSPYDIIKFICNHRSSSQVNGISITKFKLIKYVTQKNLVPLQVSQVYSICKKHSTTKYITQDTTWTDLHKRGKGAFLCPTKFAELVKELKRKSSGGHALSFSEIKKEIETYIIKIWTDDGNLSKLPSKISDATLNRYAGFVVWQDIFNVHTSVLNKTKLRSIAEWSFRSTLCYTMIVATTHFFPCQKLSKYHFPKKDLDPESLELWESAEKAYNKMLGNNAEQKEKLAPVLPNLLFTTDNVTIFATSTQVNKKDRYYVVAREKDLKNEFVNSGNRNHYKSNPDGDAHCRGT